MRAYFIIIFVMLLSSIGISQTVVFEEEVDTVQPLKTKNFGKNSKHYFQNYLAGGLCMGDNGHYYTNRWSSRYFEYGFRYKLKLNKAQALVMDFGYLFERNIIVPMISPGLTPYKGNITFQNLNLAIGHRFNFDWNRGNVLGVFLDLSFFASYNLATRHNLVQAKYDVIEKIKLTKIPLESRFRYGLGARLGYKKWALTTKLSLENFVISSKENRYFVFNGYQSQPITIGIEFSFN